MNDEDQDIQPYAYPHPYMTHYSIIERQAARRRHRQMVKQAKQNQEWHQQRIAGLRTLVYCGLKTRFEDLEPSVLFARNHQPQLVIQATIRKAEDDRIIELLPECDHIILPSVDVFDGLGEMVAFYQAARSHNIKIHLLLWPTSFMRRLVAMWYGN